MVHKHVKIFFYFHLGHSCLYTFHSAEQFKIYNSLPISDVIQPRHYSVGILTAVLLVSTPDTGFFPPD